MKAYTCFLALLAGLGQIFLWVIIAGLAIGTVYILTWIFTALFGVLNGG